MTTSYYTDRINLSCLQQAHPNWTQPQLAQALGRSVGWVKKWLRRIRFAQASGEPFAQAVLLRSKWDLLLATEYSRKWKA